MNKYTNTYTIQVEFEAESDEEAYKIDQDNLNAILHNGEFYVKKLKIKREIKEV